MSRTELIADHQATFDKMLKQIEVYDKAQLDFLVPYTDHFKAQKLFRQMKEEKRKLENLQLKCRELDKRITAHIPIRIVDYNNTTL